MLYQLRHWTWSTGCFVQPHIRHTSHLPDSAWYYESKRFEEIKNIDRTYALIASGNIRNMICMTTTFFSVTIKRKTIKDWSAGDIYLILLVPHDTVKHMFYLPFSLLQNQMLRQYYAILGRLYVKLMHKWRKWSFQSFYDLFFSYNFFATQKLKGFRKYKRLYQINCLKANNLILLLLSLVMDCQLFMK